MNKNEIDVSRCYHLWGNNRNECLVHQDDCNNIPNCYFKQLQQLKQENEELIFAIKAYEQSLEFKTKLINEYKQKLEQIKKIVKDCYSSDKEYYYNTNGYILQIIEGKKE